MATAAREGEYLTKKDQGGFLGYSSSINFTVKLFEVEKVSFRNWFLSTKISLLAKSRQEETSYLKTAREGNASSPVCPLPDTVEIPP